MEKHTILFINQCMWLELAVMPFAASPKSDLLLKVLDAIEALDAFEVLEEIDILEVTLPGLVSRLVFWFLLLSLRDSLALKSMLTANYSITDICIFNHQFWYFAFIRSDCFFVITSINPKNLDFVKKWTVVASQIHNCVLLHVFRSQSFCYSRARSDMTNSAKVCAFHSIFDSILPRYYCFDSFFNFLPVAAKSLKCLPNQISVAEN